MANFVVTDVTGQTHLYGESASYRIDEDGFLRVTWDDRDSTGRRTRFFSPAGWMSVEEKVTPPASPRGTGGSGPNIMDQ